MTDKTILHDIPEEVVEYFRKYAHEAMMAVIKDTEDNLRGVASTYSLSHLLCYLMNMNREELIRSVLCDLEGHDRAKVTMQVIVQCTQIGVFHLITDMLKEETQCRAASVTDIVHDN